MPPEAPTGAGAQNNKSFDQDSRSFLHSHNIYYSTIKIKMQGVFEKYKFKYFYKKYWHYLFIWYNIDKDKEKQGGLQDES